jgi:hypothetical protein
LFKSQPSSFTVLGTATTPQTRQIDSSSTVLNPKGGLTIQQALAAINADTVGILGA